ncbi:GNAT family N-acetyltransferase [Bacillus tianshenii]|uniref:GNAT family N-acetyltransferase n=1 Tax=Sutcliffiella tianshenii TaxID=1463404 RepID=UPI001CD4528E|nr:GNAT family N-acetyltransferase [Bacillus tianshenii]MCA1321950.1 GNAT family N-acetyltransferase [Bacillus tianshenii]
MNSINVVFPDLETERMDLRNLTLEHSEQVYQHFSDSDVTRFMDIEPCRDIEEASEIIRYHEEDAGCRWGLFDKGNGNFLGTIGFHYIRSNQVVTAEIGFDLSKAYWGKGFMTEAMKEAMAFGFREAGFDTIDATVEPENKKSLQLLRKLGFHEDREPRDGLIYFYMEKEKKAQ